LAGRGAEARGLRLVLGLGNPGARYEGTRHNLGAMAVRELGRRHGLDPSRKGFGALWAKGRVLGQAVILALPQTYMNLSGRSAREILDYFDLEPADLVAVHDDLDLELGRLKLAVQGGAAGHKGILSIIGELGGDKFTRLKVGIGRPRYEEPVEQYVLNGFYADQGELAGKVVEVAADCLEVILTRGEGAAMQQYHRRKEEVEGKCKD